MATPSSAESAVPPRAEGSRGAPAVPDRADRSLSRADTLAMGAPITAAFLGLLMAREAGAGELEAVPEGGDAPTDPNPSPATPTPQASAPAVFGLAEGVSLVASTGEASLANQATPGTTAEPGLVAASGGAGPTVATVVATAALPAAAPAPSGISINVAGGTGDEGFVPDDGVSGLANLEEAEFRNPTGVFFDGRDPANAEQREITGTDGDDVLVGNDLDNVIRGLAGDDWLVSNAGDNLVFAGEGNDAVFVIAESIVSKAYGSNQLLGEGGYDRIFGGAEHDSLDGGAGWNWLYGGGGDDRYVIDANVAGFDFITDTDGFNTLALRNTAGHTISYEWVPTPDGLPTKPTLLVSVDGIGRAVVYDYDLATAHYRLDVDGVAQGIPDGQGGLLNHAPAATAALDVALARQYQEVFVQLPQGLFRDVDAGDRVMLSAQLEGGAPLPDWLVFDAASGTFRGPPGFGDAGALRVEVTGTDTSGAVGSVPLTIQVFDGNRPPMVTLQLASQDGEAGLPFQFSLPEGLFFDPDVALGDNLTIEAPFLPAWLSFDGSRFNGTPSARDVGTTEVVLVATDASGAAVSTKLLVAVEPARLIDSGGPWFPGTVDGAVLEAGEGGAVLVGTARNDVLVGGGGDDTLNGGVGGYDRLFGGPGNDRYVIDADAPGLAHIVDRQGVSTLQVAASDPAAIAFAYDAAARQLSMFVGDELRALIDDYDPAQTALRLELNGTAQRVPLGTDAAGRPLFLNHGPHVEGELGPVRLTEQRDFALPLPPGTFGDVDPGDLLTYTAKLASGAVAPAWLTVDPLTGQLSGTAPRLFGEAQQIDLVLTATDTSGSTASTPLTLRVTENSAPEPETTGSYPDLAVAELGTQSWRLAKDVFADTEGDAFELVVTLKDGAPLPGWLTFDPATSTLIAAPGVAQHEVGQLELWVRATDGELTSATPATFQLSVLPQPDFIDPIERPEVYQDAPVELAVTGTYSGIAGASLTASLADGSPLPSWLAFDGTRFSGTPTNAEVGTLELVVRGTSPAGHDVSMPFALEVQNVNDAPQRVADVVDRAYAGGDAIAFSIAGAFDDADLVHGDRLTYAAKGLPSWLSPGSIQLNPETGAVTGTAERQFADQSHTITIVATDAQGASAEASFGLEVAGVNTAPKQLGFPAAPVSRQGEPLSWHVDPRSMFSDPDVAQGDVLTFTVQRVGGEPWPAWLTFDPATGRLSGTPTNADVGLVELRVTATDSAGASATSQSLYLNVLNSNDPPVVAQTMPAQVATAGEPLAFALPSGLFSDPDTLHSAANETIGVSAIGLPSWLTFNPATQGFSTVGAVPVAAEGQVHTITVTATDRAGAKVSTSFELRVGGGNEPPQAAGNVTNQQASAGEPFSVVLPAGLFVDGDGDALAWSVARADGTGLPAWLAFDPVTRTLGGTPPEGAAASLALEVVARDPSGAMARVPFSIDVAVDNRAPLSGDLPDFSFPENAAVAIQLPATLFADPDGDPLTLTARLADGGALPAWLGFDPATRTLAGTPGPADAGTLEVVVTAADPSGAAASTSFRLTVGDVADAPAVAVPLVDVGMAEGVPLVFAVPAGTFRDPDGDALAFSARLAGGAPLPPWLVFDEATATFTAQPGYTAAGSYGIEVRGTDPSGLAATSRFTLIVEDVNRPPEAGASLADTTATAGAAWSYALPAAAFVDPDGDAPSFAVTVDGGARPGWLTVDPATGALSGTPPVAGSHVIAITASDGKGGAVTQELALAVAPAPAEPTWTAPDFGAFVPVALNADGSHTGVLPAPSQNVAPTSAGGRIFYRPDSQFHDLDYFDRADYAQSPLALAFDNVRLTGTHKAALFGGDGDNFLVGNVGANSLHGEGGNDTLIGGAGADELVGGPGQNVLYGGSGVDTYRVGLHEDGFDTVYDHDGAGTLDFGDTAMGQLAFGVSGADAVVAVMGEDGFAARIRVVDYADGSFDVRAGDETASLADQVAVWQTRLQVAPAAMQADVLDGFLAPNAAAGADLLEGYGDAHVAPAPLPMPQGLSEAQVGLLTEGYLLPDGIVATGEEAAAGLATKPFDPHDPNYG